MHAAHFGHHDSHSLLQTQILHQSFYTVRYVPPRRLCPVLRTLDLGRSFCRGGRAQRRECMRTGCPSLPIDLRQLDLLWGLRGKVGLRCQSNQTRILSHTSLIRVRGIKCLHFTSRSVSTRCKLSWMARIWIADNVPKICPSCPGCAPKAPAIILNIVSP